MEDARCRFFPPAQWLFAIATLILGLGFGAPVHAQERLTPDSILTMLRSVEGGTVVSGRQWVSSVFGRRYEEYTAADRQELLDGIERLARGGMDPPRPGTSRAFAIFESIVRIEADLAEAREVPDRVIRVFKESEDVVARSLAVRLMGRLYPHVPEARAQFRQLLIEVAIGLHLPDRVQPLTAIDALQYGGEPAIPILRQLHEEELVHDRAARVRLRHLGERGYRR